MDSISGNLGYDNMCSMRMSYGLPRRKREMMYLKFCKVSCDTLPYGGRDHQKVTLGETPTSDRDSTVAYGRPSAPRHSTARHRMACGESNELAHGTVTTVASRDPHPCLSQGLSPDSPEAVC